MKIKINKIEAAKSQLQESISLFFEQRDPVSIHTLSRAALEILHDHMVAAGIPTMLHKTSPAIKDEFREMWAKSISDAKNFFKHADKHIKEGRTEIIFETELNAFSIFDSIYSLQLLESKNYVQIPEHIIFTMWFSLKYPQAFNNNDYAKGVKDMGLEVDKFSDFLQLLKDYKNTPPEVIELYKQLYKQIAQEAA